MPTCVKSDKTGENKSKGPDRPCGASQSPQTAQTGEKSNFFFLAKFDSEEISHQERLPKTFAEFEGLLSKILINLEETEYVFRNQAKEILDRDLALYNLRTKLKKFRDSLNEKKRLHERINQSMQFVFRLGSQISGILSEMENEFGESPQLINGRKYTPGRMRMYDIMLNLNLGQKEMLQKISDAVLSVNDVIDCNPSDPIEKFTRILSLHMETLRIIESKIKQSEEELRSLNSLHEFFTNLKNPAVCEYYY